MSPDEHDPATCPLHGEALVAGRRRIAYGMPATRPDGPRCPRARSWRTGGCVVPSDGPRDEPVLYCPSCRAEEAREDAERRPPRF